MLTITKDGRIHIDQIVMPLEDFGDFDLVKKKPIVVHAMEMHKPFRAEDQVGNMTVGAPGDFLLKGVNGEYYCVSRDVFFKSYDKVL